MWYTPKKYVRTIHCSSAFYMPAGYISMQTQVKKIDLTVTVQSKRKNWHDVTTPRKHASAMQCILHPKRYVYECFVQPWRPFEEEEEGTSIVSDVFKVEGGDPVKVEGEDPPTPGCLREDMMRRYVGDSQSWVRAPVAR